MTKIKIRLTDLIFILLEERSIIVFEGFLALIENLFCLVSMASKKPILLILLICHAFFGFGQNQAEQCEICVNGEHKNESPYKIGIKKELPFLIVGGSLLTTGFIIELNASGKGLTAEDIAALDASGINSFDRNAVNNLSRNAEAYSDFFRSTVTIFPAYFLTNFYTQKNIGPLLVMSLEVLMTTYGITNMTKNIANRPRPFTYNSEVSIEKKMQRDANRSFFSGHTSHTAAFSFFMAKVLNDYHPNAKPHVKTMLWVTAATIPALTGYLRVEAGKHFPTDVITGYIIGAAVGYLVPHLHLKKKKRNDRTASIIPIIGPSYSGFSMTIPLGLSK